MCKMYGGCEIQRITYMQGLARENRNFNRAKATGTTDRDAQTVTYRPRRARDAKISWHVGGYVWLIDW
jgi:hypothetical protein